MEYFYNLGLTSQKEIDEYIIKLFYTQKEKLNSNRFFPKWKEKNPEIFNYLNTRYNDSSSIYETLYRIKYNLEIRPTCIICGNYVKFIKGYGFSDHCSAKCSANDPNTRKKHKDTCLERYNETSYTKTKEYKEKTIKTSLEKYGVEHPTKRKEYKDYLKQKFINEYGVDSYFKTDEFKEKSKETCKEKYGKEYITQTDLFKEKSKKTCKLHYGTDFYLNSNDCIEKTHNAQIKNKGYSGSKKEYILYNILISKFGEVKREYISSEYPYHCDFYIPSINLFIEFNGMWVHGKHAYDSTNKDDIEKLNYWKEKSLTSSYYKRAIKIWTNEDVIKREYAKQHNLNWIEGWTINEILDKIYINTNNK